ncbi:MAG: ATP-dependent DNA helicase UvrD2 [Actinomycetota bacterium]|nr:ATP-dependent DNA helicase UvrD2 [Actinomycetota bacterium]
MVGPPALGRGVVVLSEQNAPANFENAERVVIDNRVLAAPAAILSRLHTAWLTREPVVIELACDPAALRTPELFGGPVFSLDPSFQFPLERLQFLVWTNTYDARSGRLIWWHARKVAKRMAARGVREGGQADLLLSDGTAVYVDGGPADPPDLPTRTPVVHRWSAEFGRLPIAEHRSPSAELAPDQLAAVAHRFGAARVVAPAGSGKTRVLTERLRHLVVDRHVHPSTITALAYNKEAADEMKQRCSRFVSRDGPNIRTLNSLGLWVCNELGGDGRRDTLDESGVRDLVEEVFPVRHKANADTVVPFIDALSAVRLGLASPNEVEAVIPDASGLAEGFETYRVELRRRRALDFDEQIYRAIEILVSDPAARSEGQRSCRRMLVDEFQDLKPAHLLLIRLLCAPGYDCFGVGDDDQVIYGYSGATPTFLMGFDRYFPGAGSHALEVNYRCPPAVVEAARHLLSYNKERLQKRIVSPEGRSDPRPSTSGALAAMGPVTAVGAKGEKLAHVALDIVKDWLAGGTTPDDVAVLARVNSALLPVQVACLEAGVAVVSTLGSAILKRTGMRTALAYLRIAQHPDLIARADIVETVHRPSRKISRNVAEMLTKRPHTSVSDIRRLASRLSGEDAGRLVSYAKDLEHVAGARSTAEALRRVRLWVGLGASMDELDGSRGEVDRSTHADDLLALEMVAPLHPDIATFESWITGMLTQRRLPGSAVVLSTVHKIKGKEWPRVVVFGVTEGLFPHRRAEDEEEERRVFHVALTRASLQVAVIYDEEAPSPFLAELDGSRPRAQTIADVRKADREATYKAHHGSVATTQRRERRRSATPSVVGPRSRRRVGRPPRSPIRVEAAIGLELEVGGQHARVVELRQGGALVRMGAMRTEISYGTDVRVEGSLVTLAAPVAGGELSPEGERLEQALREWRSETARADKVPAYVVLNDVELKGVAMAAPTSLSQLGRCRGIGPIRLERYGDEILAVIERALA